MAITKMIKGRPLKKYRQALKKDIQVGIGEAIKENIESKVWQCLHSPNEAASSLTGAVAAGLQSTQPGLVSRDVSPHPHPILL